MVTAEILNSHSVATLKKEISKTNVKGYSKMKKPDVVALMLKNKDRFSHIKHSGKSAPKAKAKPATPKPATPKAPTPKAPTPTSRPDPTPKAKIPIKARKPKIRSDYVKKVMNGNSKLIMLTNGFPKKSEDYQELELEFKSNEGARKFIDVVNKAKVSQLNVLSKSGRLKDIDEILGNIDDLMPDKSPKPEVEKSPSPKTPTPKTPTPKSKSATPTKSPTGADLAVAQLYGMGHINAIKGELNMLLEKMVKDLKARIKKVPTLKQSDFEIIDDDGQLTFNSDFGTQFNKDQARAKELKEEWASIKGIGSPGLQSFMGKYNRQIATQAKKLAKGENAKKKEIAEAIFEARKANASPSPKPVKPTQAEGKALIRAMKGGQRAFLNFVEKSKRNAGISLWVNENTAEFKRNYM